MDIKISASDLKPITIGKGKLNYPNTMIPSLQKDENYHKKWAEKIYSLFQSGNTWMPAELYSKIDEYRAWSDGEQSMEHVKDWVLGKTSQPQDISAFDAAGFDIRDGQTPEKKRKAWVNIDFSPVSVSPKIKTKINEHIRSMYYEMRVKAIDSYSVKAEEHEKYRLWFYKQNQKFIQSSMAAVGLEMPDPDFLPENLEELELYASSGGIRVPYSISMEDLIKHTYEVSSWDKEIAERLRDDFYTLGYGIVYEEFDRELKRVVARYADPKYSGVQFSNTRGYKDSEWGYTMEFKEVSYIRQRLNLTQQEAAALAFGYSDKFGNPSVKLWDNYNSVHSDDNGNIYLDFDFYKIPVFFCEFTDIDNEAYIEFMDKFGNQRTKRYNGQIQDNEKLRADQFRYIRTVKWIPGTKHIFDWGIKEYIPRDAFNKPRTSFRAIRLMSTPILKQILPFLKGFGLAWIKAQHAIAIAVNNGLAIDIGALKNISIGKDESFNPMEVLSFYRQSSFLLYKKPQSITGINKYGSPPVIPIQNGMYENIRAQFEAMNIYMQKIEDVSGISMTAMGKTPDPDVAKYNMQVTLQGTNEIINSISRAQTDLQEDLSVNVCYRIRSYCRMNPAVYQSYCEVIGERRMLAVMMAEKNHVEYGITIEASDITEEKRTIMAMIQASISPEGANSQGKLTPSEAMIVIDMIHQGQNLRRVGLVLGYLLRKKEREAAERQQRMIEIQGQQNKDLELIKSQQMQQEREFQLILLSKKFWSDYTVKYGSPPAYEMGEKGSETANKEVNNSNFVTNEQ